jgi:alanine racemase
VDFALAALREAGCQRFAVATPDEAISLREKGIGEPILVLGPSPYGAAREYLERDITPAVCDPGFARAMSEVARGSDRPARVHLKIDSGMGRAGFLPSEIEREAEELLGLPGLDLEGIFTHFATADEVRLDYTETQFRRFGSVLECFRTLGVGFRLRHCCNSAALMRCPRMRLDGVRPGIILYGMAPSPVCPVNILLKPVFSVKTGISQIRELPPGSGVSYGLRYTTRGEERIAVLPLGYRDGWSRSLMGRARALVRGVSVPFVGTICMDQCMIDVTDVPGARVGDEVVLLGEQGGQKITADDLATLLGTINYEVPGLFSERVPRIGAGTWRGEP